MKRKHESPTVDTRRIDRKRSSFTSLPIALVLASACGCASPQRVDRRPTTDLGSPNPPMVISSRSESDTIAYLAASEELNEAEWRVLQKLGPKAIWQQLMQRERRSDKLRERGELPPRPQTEAAAFPEAAAANQPIEGIAPTVVRKIGEIPKRIPASVADLPDDKVRIIWHLGNYGGSQVTSSRDSATARRTVNIAAPELTPIVTVLTTHLGDAGIVSPMPSQNALVITCPKSAEPSVLQLLSELDVAAKQVEISVKIFEVTHDFDFQQGTEMVLNHLNGSNSQQLISTFSAKRFAEALLSGGADPVQGSVVSLMQAFESAGVSVEASFQLLASSGMIQVVSAPRITVAVGQTGYLLAGRELPITSANIVNDRLQASTRYKPVGVQLYITPQATGENHVKLHTISIVSAVAGFADLPEMTESNAVFGTINPIIDSREAETVVTVNDNDTLVISGLRMVRNTIREEKVPGLGDIPGLEWLFKNHRTQQQATDLYFFVTPKILPTATVRF